MKSEKKLSAVYNLENNCFEFLKNHVCLPGGRSCDLPELKWINSGTKIFNRIYHFHVSKPKATSAAVQVLDQFKKWDIPFSWVIGPSSHPQDMESVLLMWGLQRVADWDGMAMDLKRWEKTVKPEAPKGFSIEEVEGERLKIWTRIVCDGFGIAGKNILELEKVFRKMHGRLGGAMRCYLGLMNGEPVSTGMNFLHEKTAGLYWIATTAEKRKHGYGTSMTCHLLDKAASEGNHSAVLQATAIGKSTYQKLGFETCCKFANYYWIPEHFKKKSAL